MNENDLILIDRYLAGELTPEERLLADKRRRDDPAFDMAVQEMEQAIEAIRVYRREELRKEFKAIDLRLDRGNPEPNAKRTGRPVWMWIGIAAAVACLLWWTSRFLVSPAAPGQPPAHATDTLPQDLPEPNIAQPETAPQKPPKSVPGSQTPTEKPKERQAPDGQALFAEYFEPYKDLSMDPGDRSMDEPEGPFEALYWAGRYADAIQAYPDLPLAIAQRETIRFRYANALMTQGRVEEARPLLIQMVNAPASTYGYEARYLLALADLRRGDLGSAKEHLRIYRDQKIAVRRDRADALLARLAE